MGEVDYMRAVLAVFTTKGGQQQQQQQAACSSYSIKVDMSFAFAAVALLQISTSAHPEGLDMGQRLQHASRRIFKDIARVVKEGI